HRGGTLHELESITVRVAEEDFPPTPKLQARLAAKFDAAHLELFVRPLDIIREEDDARPDSDSILQLVDVISRESQCRLVEDQLSTAGRRRHRHPASPLAER